MIEMMGSGFCRSRRHFFHTDRLGPFGDDGIALLHGHAGIGGEHLRASAAAPGEKTEKMFLAQVLGAGRGVDPPLAALDQTIQIIHQGSFSMR